MQRTTTNIKRRVVVAIALVALAAAALTGANGGWHTPAHHSAGGNWHTPVHQPLGGGWH
jgi:hypothetical protein